MVTGAAPGSRTALDRAIQRGYLRIWLTVSAVFAVVVAGTAFFGWWVLARTSIQPYYLETLNSVFRANAVLLILVTLFMGLYTVLLSHRIIGPTWRIQEALRRGAEQRAFDELVDLADHDYLQGVAQDVNRLLRLLASDQRRVRKMAAAMRALAVEMETVEGGGGAEALTRMQQELVRLADRLEKLAQPVEPMIEQGTGETPQLTGGSQ